MKQFKLAFLIGFALLTACKTTKSTELTITEKGAAAKSAVAVFDAAFTGYQFIQLDNGKVLYQKNQEKYFRPGSNIKFLTMYICMRVLKDSLAAYRFYDQKDSVLVVQGMADPSMLHPKFRAWHDAQKLPTRTYPSALSTKNWYETAYGSGWMWDDLDAEFAAPRSPIPVQANMAKVFVKNGAWVSQPADAFDFAPKAGITRPVFTFERMYVPEATTSKDTFLFPMGKPIQGAAKALNLSLTQKLPTVPNWKTKYATPLDTALRFMMQESDNLFAEHLLLQCGMSLTDSLNTKVSIDYAQKKWFASQKTPPIWVDGSGISDYNLLTPEFQVWLLRDLWKTYDRTRLTRLLAAGGVSGTIKNWYAGADGKPYVFAKTGTLRHVHTLSGYLKTKKGKWVAFCFMHNNFSVSNTVYKQEMLRFLEKVRDEN
jgi:serine-type D-Ala-D-Ala carboxypeptidase/endopeptidase (penicillin-binding protein 4)